MQHILAVTALLARADPGQQDLEFQSWLRGAAEVEQLHLVMWGALDLDHDGRVDEQYAFVCSGTPANASWIVFGDEEGTRWVVERSEACVPGVPHSDSPTWNEMTDRPGYPVPVTTNLDEIRLGLVDGRVEVVEAATRNGSPLWAEAWTTDWRSGTRRGSWRGRADDAYLEGANESALLTVSGSGERSSTFDTVLSGGTSWTGSGDASVRVSATQIDDHRLRVVVDVTDDQLVPARSEADLTSSDHLELWWCPSVACADAAEGWPHVMVGRSTSGSLFVRHDGPGSDESPRVSLSRGDGTVFDALFSLRTLLGAAPGADDWQIGFTVVYADADRRSEGVQTRVGTSALVPGQPRSLGLLASYPGHSAFPTGTRTYRQELRLRSIRRLPPGQAGIRSQEAP